MPFTVTDYEGNCVACEINISAQHKYFGTYLN